MIGRHAYSCLHCSFTWPTLQAVRHHISAAWECAKKDDEEFSKRYGGKKHTRPPCPHPIPHPPAPAPSPSPSPPPSTPPLAPLDIPSDVDMDGAEHERCCRSQSMAIEELPDELYLK